MVGVKQSGMTTIGVDIGTSGCKASVVRADGTVLAGAYREYTPKATPDGGQELDSRLVLEQARQVIRESVEKCPGETISALSVSSFGESMVPLGAGGEALSPVAVYSDTRGEDVEQDLRSRVDVPRFFEITGYEPSRVSSMCRMMWLKRRRPEVYQQSRLFLPFNALLLYQLGAEPHIDVTLASTTQGFDIWKRSWDLEILSAAEIDPNLLPPVAEPGTVVGVLKHTAAQELGLPDGILLVAGGHDQQCVSLGAGVVESGDVLDGLGSVEAIGVVTDQTLDMAALRHFCFSIEPHVVPGRYSVYGCTTTAGHAVKWFRDCLCPDFVSRARESGKDVYDLMFEAMAENSEGVLWVPYFSGAGTPFNVPDAGSLLIGASLHTNRGILLRALLEGIAFEAELNLECMRRAGLSLREICAVGGLAKSERYLQMKADLMGRDVVTMRSNEAGALGAAILAAQAQGAYPSLEEAARTMVKRRTCLRAREAEHRHYRALYERYLQVHPLYGRLGIDLQGR